jgi:hypothetical protein
LSGLTAETRLNSGALLRLMGLLISKNRLIHMPDDLLVTAEVLRAAMESIANRLKTDATSSMSETSRIAKSDRVIEGALQFFY